MVLDTKPSSFFLCNVEKLGQVYLEFHFVQFHILVFYCVFRSIAIHVACALCATLQVQLLVSAKDIENYNKIRKNLDKLKFLVEESELWVQKLAREEKEAETAKRVNEVTPCGNIL